jgi:hypothetical protein
MRICGEEMAGCGPETFAINRSEINEHEMLCKDLCPKKWVHRETFAQREGRDCPDSTVTQRQRATKRERLI